MSNTLTDQRPVVFHLITGFTVGGAERMLAKVLPRLTNYRHVVISLTTDGPMRREYEKLGLVTQVLGYTRAWHIGAFGRWIRLVRQYHPRILTTYLIHADLVGRIWGKVTGIPIIVSSLRARFRGHNYRLIMKLLRFFDGWVDAYTPNSQEVRRYYIEDLHFPAEKFTVITNGLDPDEWPTDIDADVRTRPMGSPGLDPTTRIVGTVSQLRPEKGVARLLAAMAKIPDQSTHCLIIGDGVEQPALEQQAVNLGLRERIHFLGNRPDITTVLPLLDVFVLPSLFEGMSNALLEAMAAGRAIIVTDTPENREVITPETGRLVDTANPTALAEAIQHLLDNEGERQELGRMARQRFVENFSLDEKVRQLDQLYTKLLTSA